MAWNFDGTEDTLDSCEILERIEELDALIEEERDKLPEFRKQEAILLALSLEEHAEYDALKKLADDAASCPDWAYGETLIRESYFEEYIEQLIDDCYPEVSKALSSGEWPMRHLKLDIEDAANEAKADYIEVDFNGSTYLIRA
jgi:hypothetical protein